MAHKTDQTKIFTIDSVIVSLTENNLDHMFGTVLLPFGHYKELGSS